MSGAIPPINQNQASSSSSNPTDDPAISSQVQKQLSDVVGNLKSAAQQIDKAKDNNLPVPDTTVTLLDNTASQLKDLIPKVHGAEAQSSLNSALQQIQLVVQNPDAVVSPSGQVTGATMTISEVIQQ